MRIIARLDIKNEYLIKGINLEGLRKLGRPEDFASRYYEQGIDEFLLMDAVASLYNRNNLQSVLSRICRETYVPVTIGGGIRTLEDVERALVAGADKVAVNTAAVKNPDFITDIAMKYGSQCVVASIEAKKRDDIWEAYIDNGRERTGLNVVDWAKIVEEKGAGEILLTGVDHEGCQGGFDLDLIDTINSLVKIPVVASGGAGSLKDISRLATIPAISGCALASVLHYNKLKIDEIMSLNNQYHEEVV